MKTTTGALCKKHPELQGLRLLPSRMCVTCNRIGSKLWRQRNKVAVSAKRKAKYKENAERIKEASRQHYAANTNTRRRSAAAWREQHPEKRAMYAAKRNAQKKGLTVPLTAEEKARIAGFYAQARAMTRLVGEPYHVDHIKPLSKGGLHHPDNLQVLRGIDNLKKGARET